MLDRRMRILRALAERVLQRLAERRLVTWEQRDPGARLLMITNVWPHAERPSYGPFVRYTCEGIRGLGVPCDVLFIRGYRGPRAYLAGAAAALLVPIVHPRRYRLVHCHGGETALAARFFRGAPLLVSYLGTDLLGARIGGSLRSRAGSELRSILLRAHSLLASATTTKSLEMERLLPARARARNGVIPDGVDRHRFRPGDRQAACAQVGWDAEQLNVMFAGRIDSVEKRVWLAERAIALARVQLPRIELKTVSGVAPEEMPAYYQAADCLLHTSVSEGSSNVIKEALACDVPVIATPAGDAREVLANVELCQVCEADAEQLARGLVAALRERRRCDGREKTAHLDTAAIAVRTLDCYRRLGFDAAPG